MIFRLSQKLNAKVKAGKLETIALADNLFVDWSCHVFNVSRTQYIIFCNTDSLLSCLSLRKGVNNPESLTKRGMETIGSFLTELGHEGIFDEHIAPAVEHVQFAKALNRSVTGSMNELLLHAQYDLDAGLSLGEATKRLIEIPMSGLKDRGSRGYGYPGRVFEQLGSEIA
jgi:hypothetical protein